MATEVQNINDLVEAQFAEEEARAEEEIRDDKVLAGMEDFNASLKALLAGREGAEALTDLLDTRDEFTKEYDKIKTEQEALAKFKKDRPELFTANEENEDAKTYENEGKNTANQNQENVGKILEEDEDVPEETKDETEQNAKVVESATPSVEYMNGVRLRRVDSDGKVVPMKWW